MKNIKWAALVLYLSTIPLANWFIDHIGKQSAPYLPHTIPVGFGYQAPSGVLLIGLALFTRDFVQEQFGKKKTLLAICAGICISYFINPSLAVASTVAFALGELSDFFVYSEVKKKSRTAAVIISGVVGGVIDSLVFLKIAFGSTQFWQGQVIGKTIMALFGGCLLWSYHALSNRLHAKKI
jgi:uncharacterized PurR-regulated membrane protein YhhQ (DUF165 family)